MSDLPEEPTAAPVAVTAPADGVPDVIRTPEALADAARRLAAASGTLAVDTERAHGFRYWPKAYLIQLRRPGAGTFLIDPIAFAGEDDYADFSGLADKLADAEWVLHAASQDLPCLAEVNFLPRRLFDTELAGRLLGLPRVALGALVERGLGKSLAKEHSAADWSRRPLPDSWLNYAALDVELLDDLRDWAAAELESAGRTEWARQEFAHLVDHAADPPVRRAEPWRRVSGLHAVHTQRGLAVVREVWLARDEIAQRLDKAPGRVLADRSLAALGELVDRQKTTDVGRTGLRTIDGFKWRTAARFETNWIDALARAGELAPADWPPLRGTGEGIPAPKSWGRRYPEAAARWERSRPAINAIAEDLGIAAETLLSPEALRRITWQPPADITPDTVDAALSDHGARPWQRDQVVGVLTPLLIPS